MLAAVFHIHFDKVPDPYSIPFRQADGNGHYKSKELPDDKQDFLTQLGVPSVFGDVLTGETSTVNGQLTVWFGTDGHTIKGVPLSTSGIVVAQNGVGTFEAHPAGAIVGTDAVQTLTNKTFGAGITFGSGVTFTGGVTGLTKADVGLSNVDNTSDAQKNAAVATLTNKTISLPLINSPTFSGTVTGLTKTSVGLGNVDNTSDLNKPISSQTQSALDGKEALARYNVANGYAPLGPDTKVPLANLPDAALGGSRYQGTWNALTNIPPIPPAAPSNNGWYYVVNAAGNTSVDGINIWALGDTIISNGTYWQKIPNTNAVVSVNAKTGTVVLNKTDIGLANVDNTSDATKNSAAATLTNKTINGASNTLTVRLDADVVNNLPVSRLNGGSGASAATFWRGDGLWVSPIGAGDVQGPSTSVDGEVTVFSGTTGKVLRVFGGAAGFAKVGPGTALATVPSIGALDVNASLVHGQVQKAKPDTLDELLVWDSVSSSLKSMLMSNRFLPGEVVQTMTLVIGKTSTTLVIPADNTIPQIGEGFELGRITITPRFQNSQMLITLVGMCDHALASPSGIYFAAFRGAGPDAFCSAQVAAPSSNQPTSVSFAGVDLPNTLSAVIYTVRFGTNVGSTAVAFSARGDVDMFGGTMKGLMKVQEIKV